MALSRPSWRCNFTRGTAESSDAPKIKLLARALVRFDSDSCLPVHREGVEHMEDSGQATAGAAPIGFSRAYGLSKSTAVGARAAVVTCNVVRV
jgi:hypothetical protein